MYAANFGIAIIKIVKWILVGLICMLGAHRILAGLLDRQLSIWEALILLAALLGFAGLAIGLSETPWFWLILAAAIVLAIIASRIPEIMYRKKTRQLLQGDIRKYQQGITRDPKNVAGYVFLADTYMKMKRYDLAVQNYEKAINLNPNLIEEKKKLERAQRLKEVHGGTTMYCRYCYEARAKKSNECLNCGQPFSVLETISFNFGRSPKAQFLPWGVGIVGGVFVLIALLFAGRFAQASLIFVALLALSAYPLKQLSKW